MSCAWSAWAAVMAIRAPAMARPRVRTLNTLLSFVVVTLVVQVAQRGTQRPEGVYQRLGRPARPAGVLVDGHAPCVGLVGRRRSVASCRCDLVVKLA